MLITKNITKYFIYDKENNKTVASFDNLGSGLDDDFVKYYFNSVELKEDIAKYNE